jgi:ribosome-binding factor A
LDPHRHERIAESIREELEELICYELADPRIGEVAVTTVHISPDNKRAHVLLSLRGSEAQQAETLKAIEHAKGFLRHELAERLQLFHTPELRFDADMPAALAAKAPKLLRRIRRGRPKA